MKLRLSTTVRLAAGLTLLAVGLVMIAGPLGLLPDRDRLVFESRIKLAESLAIAVTLEVSSGRMTSANALLDTISERNESVRDILLKRVGVGQPPVDGVLLDESVGTESDRSTIDRIVVPIWRDAERWGSLEIEFTQDAWFERLLRSGSPYVLAAFLAIAGFLAFWLFLRRTLTELDPSAVVPDRVNAVLDTLAEGLVMLDRSGRIVLTNEPFRQRIALPMSELVGINLSRLSWDPEACDEASGQLPWEVLLEGGADQCVGQVRYRTADGGTLSFAVNVASIRAPDSQVRGVVVTFDDVTEMHARNADLERALERLNGSQREIKRQNDELRVLATTDSLTGALNRRSLFEGLEALHADATETERSIGCIMVDLDHFKSINDDFGHSTGDVTIILLARVLMESAPSGALVARYGGEEFCVVLPGFDEEQAAAVAERVRHRLHVDSATLPIGSRRITASLGVSSAVGGSVDAHELVDLADKALYRAKESGRNRVVRHQQLTARSTFAVPTADNADAVAELESVTPSTTHDDPTPPIRANAPADQSDPMTGSNSLVSAVLIDRLSHAIAHAKRFDTNLATLCIEFPTIDLVRNTAGESAAEKLLGIARSRLNDALRSTDMVSSSAEMDRGISISRTAVGHYAVLLTELDNHDEIPWIVRRIFEAFESAVDLDGREILLDTRIGASVFPSDGKDASSLIAAAGTALHEALALQERHTCMYFSDDMNTRSERLLMMQSQLHSALERGELFVVYQPLVDMHAGRMKGLEALIRWRHPELGMVSPELFIPIAGHTRLIDEIGDWVVRTACGQLKAWHDRGFTDLNVAVNLAAPQLRRADLVARIASIVATSGIDPRTLTLELTESTLIENFDVAVAVVEGLSRIGTRVALDDFGTGYSSLSYLKRFPIDIVKIDRSFFTDFPDDEHGMAIVSAIISLVHSLGLSVTAEGVETVNQLAFLESLEVDTVQGYYFSPPLKHEQVSALLQHPEELRSKLKAAGRTHDARKVERPAVIEGVLSEAPRRAA